MFTAQGGKDAGSGLGSREELQQRVGGEGEGEGEEGGGEWSAWTAGSEGAVESQVAIHVTEAAEAPPPPPEFQLNTDLTCELSSLTNLSSLARLKLIYINLGKILQDLGRQCIILARFLQEMN